MRAAVRAKPAAFFLPQKTKHKRRQNRLLSNSKRLGVTSTCCPLRAARSSVPPFYLAGRRSCTLNRVDPDDGELHDKPAHAVPLASASQRPENQKENQAGHSSENHDFAPQPQLLRPRFLVAQKQKRRAGRSWVVQTRSSLTPSSPHNTDHNN